MSIGYIASGGIGNRVAAISSCIYDSQYKNINLIWEPAYYGNIIPENLWQNWNLKYFLNSQCQYDCRNWYIHANAAKSLYVRSWWQHLITNNFIINELNKFNLEYECTISIRNVNVLASNFICDYDKLCNVIKNIPDEKILVVSDNNDSIKILLEKSNKKFHYYKTPHRINTNPNIDSTSPRSEEEVYSAMVDWYLIQRSKTIYKNNPLSTFTDYAEFICDIPINIII